MAPTLNNPSYDRSVNEYLPWVSFQLIPVPRNSVTNFKLEGVYVTGSRYINTLQLPSKEAGLLPSKEASFYSNVVECLPVDPAT